MPLQKPSHELGFCFFHMAATKRTPKIEDAIIASIRNGAFPKHAAEANGIAKSTLHEWINDEASDFGGRIARARADALNECANVIRGSDDWRAKAWWAERMAPDEFGDRAKLEISGSLAIDSLLLGDPDEAA